MGGYDANGNVLSYIDSVMGQWSFGYDQLNRLVTAQSGAGLIPGTPDIPTPGWASGPNFCWAYDAFGNRLQQGASNTAFSTADGSCSTSGSLPQNVWASYSAQNQMTSTNAPGWTISPPAYDGAGDVANDGRNAYLYDAEGRICAVNTAPATYFGYLYDAAGNRVAKGSITSWSCDITANGFTQTEAYVVGPSGEQLTELDGSNNWKHTNVYAGGKLIGTYDGNVSSPTLHFHFDDPLGTRRAEANASGVMEAEFQSLPFGDGLAQSGSVTDPTENHFTGKERDAESGNDYFGARYYSSNVGRWMSPDWSAKQDPVPYAKLENPQSLNLYSYVYNNPINGIDPDGHFAPPWHFLLSFFAAISVGENPFSAAKLGILNAWSDVGTQDQDPAHCNIHGMRCNQSVADAYRGMVDGLQQDEDNGNEGRVQHRVQDPFAKGHEGIADWTFGYGDFGGFLNHQLGDWLPNPSRLLGAFKASRKALKDRHASPESLLPDDPGSSSDAPSGPDTSGGYNGGVHDESGEASRQCKSGNPAACD